MRKKYFILFILLVAFVIIYTSSSTETYFGRYIKWRTSDISDFEKFPKYEFKSSKNPFYFIEKTDNSLDTLCLTQNKKKKTELLDLLKISGTTAFLIIKNDTLLFEKYLNGYHRNSINTSFSVAKSITSLLTGKAVDEHFIQNVNDPVIKYIPDLIYTDPKYDKLLISHLLDMRSGILFKDHDLPWGDKPKAYYYPDLRKRVMELPMKYEPGGTFRYNSYNPIVVGMILEKVTNQPPAKYFEKVIWNELDMEYSGSWSMDSQDSRMTKMESGLNIRAIDFAKFGRLVINKGNWNGKQLLSKEWMDYSFTISKDFKLTEFADDLYYRNFWWIYANKKESEFEITCIAGTGHLGQYLFIFPKEKIIIVRMGKENSKVDSWRTVFQEIIEYISNKYAQHH